MTGKAIEDCNRPRAWPTPRSFTGTPFAFADASASLNTPYIHIDGVIMARRNQPEAPQYDECGDDRNAPVDRFAVDRAHLRMTRDDLATEVVAALEAAGLSIKVLFMDPVGDEALINFATDIDPVNRDWPRVMEIICSIVGRRVGIDGLWCRNVPRTS